MHNDFGKLIFRKARLVNSLKKMDRVITSTGLIEIFITTNP
jgi:hypothetical protein